MLGELFLASNCKVFSKSCLNIHLESGLGGHLVSFNFYDLWSPANQVVVVFYSGCTSRIMNTRTSINTYSTRTVWQCIVQSKIWGCVLTMAPGAEQSPAVFLLLSSRQSVWPHCSGHRNTSQWWPSHHWPVMAMTPLAGDGHHTTGRWWSWQHWPVMGGRLYSPTAVFWIVRSDKT